MATYIQDTLDAIDTAVGDYAETVFTDLAGPMTTTIQIMGIAALASMGLNAILQFSDFRVTEYLRWSVRFVVILSVATTWAQFAPIYEILTNTPGAIGAELLGATNAPNLNVALDEMVTQVFAFSDQATEESSWFSVDLTAVLLIFLGAIMAGVAILVSAVAKVGLALAVSIAPVFIATLLWRATSDLFSTWARFTIGFALIPLVLAGAMGAILAVGQQLTAQAQQASTISGAASFIIVVFIAIILMLQVPTMVNGLAGSIVATASAAQAAHTAANMGLPGFKVAKAGGRHAGQQAVDAGRTAASGVGAARASRAEGAPIQQMVNDAGEQMAKHRKARMEGMERLREREARRGHLTTMGERYEAGRAALHQSTREAAKTRQTARDAALKGDPDVSSPSQPRMNRKIRPGKA